MKRNVYWVVNIVNGILMLPPPSGWGVSNYWGVIRLLCQVKCSAYSLHDCWAVSATAALALYSRDNVDTWNCVNKTKYGPSCRAGLLSLYLRFSCSVLICLRGHYSVNQLPLKYGNCVFWAIKRLYCDDETHSTICVQRALVIWCTKSGQFGRIRPTWVPAGALKCSYKIPKTVMNYLYSPAQ